MLKRILLGSTAGFSLAVIAAGLFMPSITDAVAQVASGCENAPSRGVVCRQRFTFRNGITIGPATTVAQLPACNATTQQDTFRIVTDATAPTYNGALTGGGAVRVPVYCNGTAWLSH